MNTYYKEKYMKYKEKYIKLKKSLFGSNVIKKNINAILLPHAGIYYIKQIMDYIFNNIDFDNIDKIILLSTNHFRDDNLYFSNYDEFENKQLREHSPISIKDYINKKPVEIYLISYFDENLANKIKQDISEKTLLIANTDLLHCGNLYDRICPDNIDEYNRKIIDEIITTYDITNHDICGYNATKMFLYIIKKLNYKFVEYAYNSSDKINNDNSSSVGYVGIVFNNDNSNFKFYLESNKYLLDLPKKYLETYFNNIIKRPTEYRQIVKNSNYIMIDNIEGIFVTIYKSGELRGCIGTFTLKGDIINTIVIQTHDSAFHDTRFSPLSKEEYISGLLSYKINFLKKPFITQNIFNDFIAGLHGITLYFDYTSATYLASVMIEHFNMKNRDKMDQYKFNEIKQSLQRKAGTDKEITKIELYECIEV